MRVRRCSPISYAQRTRSSPTSSQAASWIPALKVVTKRIALDRAVPEGFDALLDPAGTQLKILIELGA